MSIDFEESRWMCGRSGMVNLQRVSSIVREIREPCLHHSPTKGNKMLKREKWQTLFDSEGRVFGFGKVLKLIKLGGIEPSIRAEVWEFLLGCYALSSTAEYRTQLRMARRERYEDLVRQCQSMHSSIGTGSLAYVVGSKVMDMRTLSRDNDTREAESKNTSYITHLRKCSGSPSELISVRESAEDAAYDSSFLVPSSEPYDCFPTAELDEMHELHYGSESIFDFPPLPVTDLFHNGDRELDGDSVGSKETKYNTETVNGLRILDAPKTAMMNGTTSNGQMSGEDRVSEWLWTLHRIVVDVVRTDSHLEFYGDAKNMARMSDILAVYAWIDPATGYCQGMSDLLSPFVVLYEDNADAFWCFEMLLRRMRENFQMDGPTGVMKQLQALWKILELTDAEMFGHLSVIGAESLHFAFRMLLVLFRRELSFEEALCMWEMMWAADFDEDFSRQLEGNCLEPLVLHLRKSPSAIREEKNENGKGKFKSSKPEHNNDDSCSPYSNGLSLRSISHHPFCGLTKANFWAKNDELPGSLTIVSTRNRDDELSVFCVAAILILNRQRIIRQTRSIDDVIKMFNDNKLKINVKRCIRTAIKLRKKYFYKFIKQTSMGSSEQTKEG